MHTRSRLLTQTKFIICWSYPYLGYYFVRMSYQALMTVAYFEIVKELPKDSYGLIFGFNTFVALGTIHILRKHLEGGGGIQKMAIFAYNQFLKHAYLGGGSKNPNNVLTLT